MARETHLRFLQEKKEVTMDNSMIGLLIVVIYIGLDKISRGLKEICEILREKNNEQRSTK
jgi:hypothetical protein